MQSKELIEAAAQGNLGTVERLLAIVAIKESAHVGDNAALRAAAGKGYLAIVDRLLAIDAITEDAHAMNNAALLGAADKGHLAVVERLLAIDAVKENAHAADNAVLRWAADKGHLAIVERLLAIEVVKKNAHAGNDLALKWATERGHFAVVYILAKAYQSLNRQLPIDITIQNKTLNDFVKNYEEKLMNIGDELIRIFPKTLLKIIDDYAELALDTVISKSVRQDQSSKLNQASSDISLPPVLVFSTQAANTYSHARGYLASPHKNFKVKSR